MNSSRSKKFMRLTLSVGALCVLLAFPQSAEAVTREPAPRPGELGFRCEGSKCYCEGTSDCKELADSGFCWKGKLLCGKEGNLPKDQCWCVWSKKKTPGPMAPAAPPATRAR